MLAIPTRPQELSLAQWAQQLGRSVRQLRYAIRTGHLDRLALPPGAELVRDLNQRYVIRLQQPRWQRAALYCRAFGELGDYYLAEQALALRAWARIQEGLQIIAEVQERVAPTEIPHGLIRLLGDDKIDVIVVLTKDRLSLATYPVLLAALQAQGRGLLALLDDVLDVGDQVEAVRALLSAVQRRVGAAGEQLAASHLHPEPPWLRHWLEALGQVEPVPLPVPS